MQNSNAVMQQQNLRQQLERRPPWFVAGLACVLTVGIAGSAAFLVLHWIEQSRWELRIQRFVEGLQFRTPAELAASVHQLKQRPALAERVLPVVLRRARHSSAPPPLRLAALRVARAFIGNDERIARVFFRLRNLPEEYLAAEAVEGLAGLQPPAKAADMLGRCLQEEGVSAAVVDVVCERLISLGGDGRVAMSQHLVHLSADRVRWIVGLVNHRRPPDADEWLIMLAQEADRRNLTLADKPAKRMAP